MRIFCLVSDSFPRDTVMSEFYFIFGRFSPVAVFYFFIFIISKVIGRYCRFVFEQRQYAKMKGVGGHIIDIKQNRHKMASLTTGYTLNFLNQSSPYHFHSKPSPYVESYNENFFSKIKLFLLVFCLFLLNQIHFV